MTKRIKLLDKNLSNKIAAGEVIERPSSVVKELVENSIDAGSKKIEIKISNDCRDIRVADNGSGIIKEDITLAFLRHATSKIETEKDLFEISTLGFRGEALASIISIAKLTCITKTADDETGTKVECADSDVKTSPIGCATGTIMEVKDLFYNTPARLKFLKTSRTEYSLILELMQNLALANPSVAFTLENNGHTSLKTTGSGDISTTLSEIYSPDLMSELNKIEKTDELSGLKVIGYTSSPEFVRSNKRAVYTFLNNRTVKCPIMQKAITTAYEEMIPRGKYPFSAVYLSIPLDQVDINVHPAKREVRYINPNQIFNFVYSALKEALTELPKVQQTEAEEISVFEEVPKETELFSSAPRVYTPKTDTSFQPSFINFSKIKETLPTYEEPVSKIEIAAFEEKNEETQKPFRIIGQYANTYILIEMDNSLQIIDQHIAHERYLYEKLLETKDYSSQILLLADIIELEPQDVSLIEQNQKLLEKYGYQIHIISDKEVMFKKIPQMLSNQDQQSLLQDILKALHSSFEKAGNEILISTACHSAIKANEPLTHKQMSDLISQWLTTKHPKTCPHGRPIVHVIPHKQLAGYFLRNN